MDSSLNNSVSEDASLDDVSPKTALSTSFTISFEDENESVIKQKKLKSNMFVRRHIRALSLPIENTEENTCLTNKANGKILNVPVQSKKLNGAQKNSLSTSVCNNQVINPRTESSVTVKKSSPYDNGRSTEKASSDSESEGGTYTLDKYNEEVIVARKTIDQVFGISSEDGAIGETVSPKEKRATKTRMVGKWVEQSACALKNKTTVQKSSLSENAKAVSLKHKSLVSRIPSPIFGRREMNIRNSNLNELKLNLRECDKKDKLFSAVKPETGVQLVNSPVNGDIDTERYLKETENIVAALHNRLQNDIECHDVETEAPISNTRFNRAFSLRRDRVKKPISPVINNTAIPVRAKIDRNVASCRSTEIYNVHTNFKQNQKDIKPKVSQTFRSSCSKNGKREEAMKKSTRLKITGNGIRSTSSLSSQEIEFQNWKRRKSYDPLKAAAEDRKKKSIMQSTVGSASVSTAALTKKQNLSSHNNDEKLIEKGIARSASFHGLRHKNGYDRLMFLEDNNNCKEHTTFAKLSYVMNKNNSQILINNDEEDEDWTMPKPPSTSLQNTPPESLSSRLSLLSHTMSNSSILLSSSSNTKVNFMTLLNVTQLTNEIWSLVSSITDGLKIITLDATETLSRSGSEHYDNYENRSDLGDCTYDNSKNTHFAEKKLDEDDIRDSEEDSESNELSGNYQLKMALNNLKQIKDAVQKLQLADANN